MRTDEQRRILVMTTATMMISATAKCTQVLYGLDCAIARAEGRRALVPAADPRLQSSRVLPVQIATYSSASLGLARLAWLPRCCGEDVERELSLRH